LTVSALGSKTEFWKRMRRIGRMLGQLQNCKTCRTAELTTAELTTAQLHNCTTAQLHNCTTAERHNGTTAQRHNGTTAQRWLLN
jgi:hypothetical protein